MRLRRAGDRAVAIFAQYTPLRLFAADGSPATHAPGTTWVELVPSGTGSLTLG